jgi:hypothetical protein
MFGLLAFSCAVGYASTAGLTVEVFGNPAMRGTPRSVKILQNGFNISLQEILQDDYLNESDVSIRITGTLAAGPTKGSQWYGFSAAVGVGTCIRLWIDDIRWCGQQQLVQS